MCYRVLQPYSGKRLGTNYGNRPANNASEGAALIWKDTLDGTGVARSGCDNGRISPFADRDPGEFVAQEWPPVDGWFDGGRYLLRSKRLGYDDFLPDPPAQERR
jgi:hypothetical protein